METVYTSYHFTRCILFKSYYVVWKLYGIFIFSFPSCMFKSYYVVWKPYWSYTSSPRHAQFKSYYVVWKRRSAQSIEYPQWGLNRTMQYGNEIWLNDKDSSDVGLNRTMQYGNFLLLLFAPPVQEFKSYYVVWKPEATQWLTLVHGKFKSYYVVWKLQSHSLLFISLSEFKSYYVVWKPWYKSVMSFDDPLV